jgi:hypothetical protein
MITCERFPGPIVHKFDCRTNQYVNNFFKNYHSRPIVVFGGSSRRRIVVRRIVARVLTIGGLSFGGLSFGGLSESHFILYFKLEVHSSFTVYAQ